ncbi:BACON domain-containing protein [Thalassotalea sediminis]|uniref:BACON domain-containing protein n=1 Tax=Thalassotalea sediminis TaxID=1759089 RepID=UPI0025737055|nr:hypothetical protein [Thalassotalea sediminis]
MKDYSTHLIRTTFALALAIIVQACGESSNADKSSVNFSISADTTSINFGHEVLKTADDTVQVKVNYTGNGLLLGYAPDAQPVGWLNFSTEEITENSAVVTVKLVNADNIMPDLYNTTLRLTTGDVNEKDLVHHDIDVSLLIWHLSPNKNQIDFQATLGDEEIPSQSLTITSESNNTWSVSAEADWLSVDTNTGTGTSEIKLTAALTDFNESGLYQTTLTIIETTTGDSKTIPVSLGLDRHYLYASRQGLSFTQRANVATLQQQVTIATNRPSGSNWQATSSASWLTLTPIADNGLAVTIDGSVSLNDGLHQATIVVDALNDANQIDNSITSEVINVSFYLDSANSDPFVIDDISPNNNAIVASTYLPYIYLAQDNELLTYHAHTGDLIATMPVSPESSMLSQLVISPDGNTLLASAEETITAEDGTESTTTHRYKIDLLSNTIKTLTDSDIEFSPLQFVHVSGRHYVVTQAMEFATTDLKRVFWDAENAFFTSQVQQAKNTQSLYALDIVDSTFKRYMLTANDFAEQSITASLSQQYRPSLLTEDQSVSSFIVDDNELGIYAISPTSEWISFDGTNFTDQGLLPQAEDNTTLELVKSQSNQPYYIRFDPNEGFLINAYQQQQISKTVVTEGNQPTRSVLSADDIRMIMYIASENQLEIINAH